MAQLRRLLPILLVAALFMVVLFGDLVSAGQKPPKSTLYPTVAQFSVDGVRKGIGDDGRLYYDGLDGVSSSRVAGSGTTNGWAFDLKARRTSEPRMLIYDLSNPISGSSQSVIAINDTHGQIYDLSNMAVGEVKYVRAAFHLIINQAEYVLRFGRTPGDGSSPLQVTRQAADSFHVETGSQGDLGLYFRGNGPGEIQIGVYHVPVDLVLTNQ